MILIRKWSKKGMTDDVFDFLVLIIMILFLTIFFYFSTYGSISDKNDQSLELVERNDKVDDYLITGRLIFEKGQKIDVQSFNLDIGYLYSSGAIPLSIPEIIG